MKRIASSSGATEYRQQKLDGRSGVPRGLPRQSRGNGAAAIPATGSSIAQKHPDSVSNETGSNQQTPRPQATPARSCKQHLSFGLKAFRCRGLAFERRGCRSCKQQLSFRRKSGSSKHFRGVRGPGRHLANNNVLVSPPVLPHKGITAMLTTEQINELHRLYWSEQWPIRKIERHLNMGWKHDQQVSG